MNSFAIPGHMTLGDFVERAGKAMLKDEWLGAFDSTEMDLRQECSAMQRRRPQYEQVIVLIRTAFCTGEIGAGNLELLTGRIVAIPADFWRSPLAEAVFIAETPWLVPEPDTIGQVLLVRSDAEAWLAGLTASEEIPASKLRPTEANVRAWIADRFDSGERCGVDPMCEDFDAEFEKGYGRPRFRELRKAVMRERGVAVRRGRRPVA